MAEPSVRLERTDLDLLGNVIGAGGRAFIGIRTTKSYDAVSIGLTPGVLSVNVGNAMFAHELCTGGHINGD